MKKTKNKYFLLTFLLIFCILTLFVAYASDYIGEYIREQISTGTGSNNSKITISKGASTYYIDLNDDGQLIGDYFAGFYYDSNYGFFQLNWSNITNYNVKFTEETNRCSTGTGYKIGGFARSKSVGYIEFNYNSDIFVYYCLNDAKLHGYAYSNLLGFQSFEGIGFSLYPGQQSIKTSSGVKVNSEGLRFVNDGSIVNTQSGTVDGSTINDFDIQNAGGGDSFEIDIGELENGTEESIFYIIQ